MTQKTTDYWQRQKQIWRKHPYMYRIILYTVALGALLFFGRNQLFSDMLDEYGLNLFTEIASIGFTVLVLNTLADRRATNERKRALILQMGSPDNGFAVEAARVLEAEKWFEDGTLRGAYLWKANLAGAWLWKADLTGASLVEANLTGAILYKTNLTDAYLVTANLMDTAMGEANLTRARLQGANLTNAILEKANLTRADLRDTDLVGTNLKRANLGNAYLHGANLTGADLVDTNLAGANLWENEFNEETKLPDGTQWTSNIDMTRFTDPEHPDFWRSDDPELPAYGGR